MGQDKAVLEIAGQAMAVRVAEALRVAGAERVTAQGGAPGPLGALGLEVVPDAEPGGGPFPAVVQAVEAAGAPLVAILACDLVAPDPAAITALVQALLAVPAAVGAVPVSDGREQWVHAVWRRSAAPALRAALASGHRSLHRAAASLELVRVEGLDAGALADADGPADLPVGPARLASEADG
jgi:molybdopterin-guanine dinucleotide biosynthesis protein A